ncbi:MAG: putative quinol monooxygenase [Syntrophomonadaceae bacterium]|nr:putative quinol monooxygenase [Syntrophomonadaceae bacterium]
MIVIVATFKAKTGCEAELEKTLKTLIPYVQKEEGTRMYTLHRGIEDTSKFLFYEVYQDTESRNYHRSQSYVKEILGSIGGLVEEKPSINLYEEICSIDR